MTDYVKQARRWVDELNRELRKAKYRPAHVEALCSAANANLNLAEAIREASGDDEDGRRTAEAGG